MSKPIHIIAALDDHNGIGKQGTIPWNLPADIQRFKQLTTLVTSPENINAVIMGRKTWESIPERFRPLSNRLNIVLTSGGSVISGARHVGNFPAAIALANDDPQVENIWVIGGGSVYKEALPLAKTLYITSLHGDFECDTFFPAIPEEFALHDFSDVQKHEDIDYYFLRYGKVPSDYFEDDEDSREGKTWPPEEDCPYCPGHYQGPHKMDCVANKRPAHLYVKGSDLKK